MTDRDATLAGRDDPLVVGAGVGAAAAVTGLVLVGTLALVDPGLATASDGTLRFPFYVFAHAHALETGGTPFLLRPALSPFLYEGTTTLALLTAGLVAALGRAGERTARVPVGVVAGYVAVVLLGFVVTVAPDLLAQRPAATNWAILVEQQALALVVAPAVNAALFVTLGWGAVRTSRPERSPELGEE